MIININERWRIKSEPGNWIVQHLPPVKDEAKGRKEDVWRAMAYCRDLDRAIVWIARRQIEVEEGEYGAEALQPLVAALDRIAGEVDKARQNAPR